MIYRAMVAILTVAWNTLRSVGHELCPWSCNVARAQFRAEISALYDSNAYCVYDLIVLTEPQTIRWSRCRRKHSDLLSWGTPGDREASGGLNSSRAMWLKGYSGTL
jgi:hypothetical protein